MFASRVVSRAVPAFRQTVRQMSGHGSDAETRSEGRKWAKITLGMIFVSVGFAVYNVVFHEHDHPRSDLPYLKNRAKPFPWSCSSCDFFDMGCWDKCNKAKKGIVDEEPEEDEHAH